MKKEETLSDKREGMVCKDKGIRYGYREKYVKEFIKRLKEYFKSPKQKAKIDNLVGEKLK